VASAISHQACILGYRVLYTSTPKLFTNLTYLRLLIIIKAGISSFYYWLRIDKHPFKF
jgi:hypothetical protein